MNMRTSKFWSHTGRNIMLLMVVLLAFSACKKKKKDKNEYGVNTVTLYPSTADKNKLKSDEQYVSILYANLFQKALSASDVLVVSNCIKSIGDKQLAREVLISNFLNEPDVIIPTDNEMKADPDKFVEDAYERFLVRKPTEAEKTYFVNYIQANPDVEAEMVYFAFAMSNEYLYY